MRTVWGGSRLVNNDRSLLGRILIAPDILLELG
jgi:hypothetical protein